MHERLHCDWADRLALRFEVAPTRFEHDSYLLHAHHHHHHVTAAAIIASWFHPAQAVTMIIEQSMYVCDIALARAVSLFDRLRKELLSNSPPLQLMDLVHPFPMRERERERMRE